MNHFFYETRSKEKVKEILDEGMRSQAYHRSRSHRSGLAHPAIKYFIAALVAAGVLILTIR